MEVQANNSVSTALHHALLVESICSLRRSPPAIVSKDRMLGLVGVKFAD